jgi:hypothetical protein
MLVKLPVGEMIPVGRKFVSGTIASVVVGELLYFIQVKFINIILFNLFRNFNDSCIAGVI